MPDFPYALGKLPPQPRPSVPTFSELKANLGLPVPPLPETLDNARGGPVDWGMLGNLRLGDCAVAAFYHAVQVWALRSGEPFPTFSDPLVESEWDKYRTVNSTLPVNERNLPANMGVVETEFLTHAENDGVPVTDDRQFFEKIGHYVSEYHGFSPESLKQIILECGVAYVGFKWPVGGVDPNPGATWDALSSEPTKGGHAIILTGWDDQGYDLVSWGARYRMTYGFAANFMDEAHAIYSPVWTAATGRSLFNLGLDRLKSVS